MFVVVGYARKMTVKKSRKYGEYGSFEHLLFLSRALRGFGDQNAIYVNGLDLVF